MKSLLIRLFVQNWQRKLISLILAMIIWLVINHSMTVTKTVHNIPVKVINMSPEKTIEKMLPNGVLNQRASLVLTGNKAALENLSGNDIQVVLDAAGKGDEWVATIEKKNVTSLNPNFDFQAIISNVMPYEMIIHQSRMITEKIPVIITPPIGEAPKRYQFFDIWPYQLMLTVRGSEETIKQVKERVHKLTFNLNDISATDLDALSASQTQREADEVSFYVPNSWKKILIQQLSDTAIEIDDPQAATLRIDFTRQDLFPIGAPVPVLVFFPPKYSSTLNPETYQIAPNQFIGKKNGIKMISTPLYAKGVSRLFLETVKDMIQLVVIAAPKSERETLQWHMQFMHPHELENRYVAKSMAESNDAREDYFRNRFRNYINRFRLYTPNEKKLALKIELQAKAISITPLNLMPENENPDDKQVPIS